MEVSEKFNRCQLDIIKKEPTAVNENKNVFENIHPIKDEYSEPELHLDWDDKHNVYENNHHLVEQEYYCKQESNLDEVKKYAEGINPECINGGNKILSNQYNPRVLLERLPKSVLVKNSKLRCIVLESKNDNSETGNSNEVDGNILSIIPEGENVTLKSDNLPPKVQCSKCTDKFEDQLSLRNHLLYCAKSCLVQCSYCPFKTKYKSALNRHISQKHSSQRITRYKLNPSSEKGKNLKLKVLQSEKRSNKKTIINPRNCTLKTTNEIGSTRRVKPIQSVHKQASPKCNKALKHSNRHMEDCGKNFHEFCCKHCDFKTKWKVSFKRHMEKHSSTWQECSNCKKQFRSLGCLKDHLRICGKSPHLQCKYCSYKTNYKGSLHRHLKQKHIGKNLNHALPCPTCNKRYKNQLSLTSHLRVCGIEPRLQCNHCSYKTKRKSSLQKHIFAVHLEKDIHYFLPCSKCGKRYKNQSALTRHMSSCGRKHLQCDHCSYKTNLKSNLEKHVVAVHLEANVNHYLPCPKCGNRLKNQSSLTRHLYYCQKEPHLQCDHCSYKTKTKQVLVNHILRLHLEKNVHYFLPCPKCGNTYKNQYALTRHMSLCKSERYFQCDYCSFKSIRKPSLQRHIIGVHLKKNVKNSLPCVKSGKKYKKQCSLQGHSSFCGKKCDLECNYCSYKTNVKSRLEKHVLTVHLEKYKNYFLPCLKCGKRYKNIYSLKSHSSKCGIEPRLQCDYCTHKTNCKYSLTKHISLVHLKGNINLFLPCSKCGKKYKNQDSLNSHLQICGRKHHFKCDDCSYKTYSKHSMNEHIVRIHLEKNVNYNLPCPKCDKKYKNQQSLKRHLYICGKKPSLQCDYCPYKTNMKADLAKHIVGVHLRKKTNKKLRYSKREDVNKNRK